MEVPSGSIFLWHGSIVSIPPGWLLCDGNNGTPDLRDRFVIGAGSTYNPGASGGNVSHSHNFTSDGHAHSLPLGNDISFGAVFSQDTDPSVDTGTTDPTGHLPPFCSLAFIMKS